MCFFGGSNKAAAAPIEPPAIPEPPSEPGTVEKGGQTEIIAEKAQAAKEDRKKRLRSMKGQQSTIKTGPQGLLSKPEDVTYKKLLGT